ncbi:hypothetical protein ACN2XU_15830 [Primorskyibacter sp. 2E107]|uniref:hypothetical protein n=1 Tax=Primorskyibacter sp. 2E107 TaxID=3403458 RepID=UPI003AF77A66
MARPSLGPRLYFRKDDGCWVIRDGTKSRRLGRVPREAAEKALEEYKFPASKGKALRFTEDETKALKSALKKARERSAKKDREIDIDLDFLKSLLRQQSGKCAISHLPFKLSSRSPGRCNPYGISIDRIDSQKGYTRGNVRIVLTWVNNALLDYGDEVLRHMVLSISANQDYMKSRS